MPATNWEVLDIGLGSDRTMVEFSDNAGGVSDHALCLTVGCPGGLSEQTQHNLPVTSHATNGYEGWV